MKRIFFSCAVMATGPLMAEGKENLQYSTKLVDPVRLTDYYHETLSDYKPLRWTEISPTSARKMLRKKGISHEEFVSLVQRGYPFIVDDCGDASTPYFQQTCADYGRRFPKEHMKAEYTEGQAHINLEDPRWHTEQTSRATSPKHLSKGVPLSGPFVWHVKDETVSPKTKPELQKEFPVPYFLNRTTLNREEVLDSFEYWFALEKGGTQAHGDAYCETTISLQVSGKKTWRLGAYPNISNAFQPSNFPDTLIYKSDWQWAPEYEEVVGPGQCLVFPMGYIHETYIYPGDGPEDKCSVANTFQFQDPQPVHQWRNFMNRWSLSNYAKEENCVDKMKPYILMHDSDKKFRGKGGKGDMMKENDAIAVAEKEFAAWDKDSDGKLTADELKNIKSVKNVMVYVPDWKAATKASKKEAKEQKLDFRANDVIAYHDTDKDGFISREEYLDSIKKFRAILERLDWVKSPLMKGKSGAARQKLYKKEHKWISENLCASDDCLFLKMLEHDYKNKGKKPPDFDNEGMLHKQEL